MDWDGSAALVVAERIGTASKGIMSRAGQPFTDVRMRGFAVRTEVADALRLLDERVQILPSESIPLVNAAGRVLADAVVAAVNVPAFDRAAMDGYAVRGEDTFGASIYNPLRFQIVGESLPARPCNVEVSRNTAIRIMTGAPMPSGADAVLPAEMAKQEGESMCATDPVPPGRHVARVGEDVALGSHVLAALRRLRPQDIGLLASIGIAEVNVLRKPTVAILVTGNELLSPGNLASGCQIIDSNSITLAALTRRDGGVPMPTRYLKDDLDAIRNAIQEASADVILVSGGSSVGKEDHAPRVVAELGELPVHGIALRPASPAGIGFLGDRPVFLLPGNPVSCLCAYDLFAGRAIRRLGGRNPDLPYRSEEKTVAAKMVSAVGRVDYVRVRIVDGEVSPIAVSGASLLSTTVNADGFVLVARDSEGYAPGARVLVYLYDEFQS